MPYNIVPKSLKELLTLKNPNMLELSVLYNEIVDKYKISDPFAFDAAQLTKKVCDVKITRRLQTKYNVKNIKTEHFKFTFGEGSRKAKPGEVANKGTGFENDLYNELAQYVQEGGKPTKLVSQILQYIPKGWTIYEVKKMGELNQKRPLTFSSGFITCGKKLSSWDIGHTVTDITLCLTNGKQKKEYYLSAKFGDTVTLANIGIKKYLKEDEIKTGKITNVNGKLLLEMLGIDETKFCATFNNYGKNTGLQKEDADVTAYLRSNKIFKEFARSVLGYGYLLVHGAKNGTCHCLEITKSVMESMLDVKKAVITYPLDGKSKRLNIRVEMSGIIFIINIRNKDAGLYPSHILSDYKLKI